jgi:4-diphosphocytidyl-2-C-methyl-D-erythritol kinase
MPSLSEQARAKVNLTLRVIGRRIDGYHDLESVVAFADCADTLTLEPGGELALTVSGPRGGDCGEIEGNLVLKAARQLAGRVEGLRAGRFHLDKHLPAAAGIGGGSADAAAALRLLARLNELPLDDRRVAEAARATGADVPVCLMSRGCVMTGVGDSLLPVMLPQMPCVLVNPMHAVATRDVFDRLGLKPGSLRVGVTDLLTSIAWPKDGAPPGEWIKVLVAGHNDLEAPALAIEPVIGSVMERLRAADGLSCARMSGSGATCFALFESDQAAHAAAAAIRQAQPGWWVHAGALN